MSRRTTYYRSTPSVDADAELYLTNAAITTPSYKSAIRTFVSYLKNNSLWSRMKALYPFLTDYRNELSYTEDLSNAAWTKTANTVSLEATANPFGRSTVNKIVPTAINSGHYVHYYTNNNDIFSNYTLSFSVKSAGYDWVRLAIVLPGSNVFFTNTYFDTVNGVFGTSAGGATIISQSADSEGDGWWRVQLTIYSADTGTGSGAYFWISPRASDNQGDYVGDGVSGIYADRFQFEYKQTAATVYEPILAASPMGDQMKYNLVDARDLDAAFRIAWNGRVTFTREGACTYGGSNAYGNTFLTPATTLQQDDVSIHYYSVENRGGQARFDMGVFEANKALHLGIQYAGSELRFRINSGTLSNAASTLDARGLYSGVRRNSTQTESYKNGVLLTTESVASQGLSSYEMIVLSLNDTGNKAGNYSTPRRCAMAIISDSFTESEMATLYTGIQNFQTTVGRNVI